MTNSIRAWTILVACLSTTPLFSQISGRVDLIEGDKGTPPGVSEAMLVFVEGVTAPIPAAVREASSRVEVRSEDKTFQPRVAIVPTGSAVRFPNVDDIMHNVFSLSRGNRFDLGLYKSGASKAFTFEKPGLVRVYCNIHPR